MPPPPPTALLIPPRHAPTSTFSLFLACLRARGFDGVVATRTEGADYAAEAALVRARLLVPLVQGLGRRVLVFAAGEGAGIVGALEGRELSLASRRARGLEGGLVSVLVFAGMVALEAAGADGDAWVAWMHGVQRTYIRAMRTLSDVTPEIQAREVQRTRLAWDDVHLMVSAGAYDAAPGDVALVVDVCVRRWAEEET